MSKKILCRADGTQTMGLGHLYRLLAIAEFYKDSYEISFIVNDRTDATIIPTTYSGIIIPQGVSIEKEPEWLGGNFEPSEYIIIADGYQFNSQYQKAIKEIGYDLLYVDDLTTEYMFADIVINHSPHCKTGHFKAEEYTQFALGTKYAMLRSGFNLAAKQERKVDKIRSVFVCFGGSDQYNLSLTAVQALLKFDNISIHVVIGSSFNHDELFTLASENERVLLHKNLNGDQLCDIMKSCQMAIAPASTILYEICSVKMPVICGYYVDNQTFIYEEFARLGLIVEMGNMRGIEHENLQEKIQGVLEDNENQRFITRQQKHFDGDSKRRFLALINNLNTTFRRANSDDMMMVYQWSNDPEVRRNSYHSAEIKLEDHKVWYQEKIQDESVLFLIAMANGVPAGIVRYEVKEDHAIVGVLVSSSFRGQGLAGNFLKKSITEYFLKFSQPVLAYIKKENIASVKVFEQAGYTLMESKVVSGYDSFIYKKENI